MAKGPIPSEDSKKWKSMPVTISPVY
jgi:hypothetical protein